MKRKVIKLFLILNCLFIILTFLLGAPFAQINRFTLPELQKNIQTNNQVVDQPSKPVGTSIIDIGITESGTIRNIVWKGAVDIFRHYPLFGAGVESFAFAYYKFRPVEHNLTSEWDFLYNKAHNEYLNYAANSGAFGLGSYLLIILVFIWWTIKNIKNSRLSGIHDAVVTHSSQTTSGLKSNIKYNNNFAFSILQFALFASYASILITNFFGFSVVIIQLFFFLIPAITFVLNQYSPLGNRQATPQGWTKSLKQVQDDKNTKLNKLQFAFVVILLFVTCYLLFAIYRLWQADFFYAKGYNNSRSAEFSPAYQNLRQAILLRNNEPLYYDEIAFPAAALSLALIDEGESTGSAQLANEAIESSTKAVTMSGNNVNFWKTRTRVFYTLSQLDEKYLDEAKSSLEVARTLSPTDPKIVYNLAIIYQGIGKTDEALNLLAETIRLKVDYRDAYFAQALIYEEEKQNQKAIDALNFILNRINPEDEEAKQKLEELK